ncbi:MAG TPA: PH domain-containing protein [Rhodanobacteraceae bacterium]|nr:PH domain-containing protein [Rhodanobacteraceae bacterium]
MNLALSVFAVDFRSWFAAMATEGNRARPKSGDAHPALLDDNFDRPHRMKQWWRKSTREMTAAGVRRFAGGLDNAESAIATKSGVGPSGPGREVASKKAIEDCLIASVLHSHLNTSVSPFGWNAMAALKDFDAGRGWLRPSPQLWRLRRVQGGVAAVIAVIATGVVVGIYTLWWLGLVAAAVVFCIALLALRALRRRVHSWQYLERDDDLIVARGLMVRRLSVVPYGRMQFVDVVAGPFERMFGISTLHMHTAAAASDAVIPGLSSEEAQRLRDALSRLGEARAAGL